MLLEIQDMQRTLSGEEIFFIPAAQQSQALVYSHNARVICKLIVGAILRLFSVDYSEPH